MRVKSSRLIIISEGKAEVRWRLGRGRHRVVPPPLWGMLWEEEAHTGLLHLPARERKGGQAPRREAGGQPEGEQAGHQGPELTCQGAVPGKGQNYGMPVNVPGGPPGRLEVHDSGV